ncbi:MAG: MFS transporter [Actinobacteria bacterium]|jgi:MFS family permease|nr:MFS transporter [Actinomycetota bacterium]NCW94036.1 MFS transporter [Actinomycetota bacterium]NCX35712.1 MFS transporter [Actinomycetota bacterium]
MNLHPKVVLLQLSNFTSGLGNSIVMITIPWLILERTDSPAFAGLVAALSAIPGLLISPIGGWLVDHLGRRAVSIGADILSSISVIAFPISAATIGLSNSTILLIALFGAVFDPAGYTARRTMLVDVSKASKVELDRLNGIHDGFLGVAWIFGPAVGAWLISSIGAINSFWVSGGLFMLAAIAIISLRVGDSGREARLLREVAGEKSDSSLRIGFQVLWNDRLLRTITISILVIAAVYLPTESVILPTYFEEKGNPSGLGLVISALAAGSATTAFGYGWLSKKISRKTLARVTLLGSALSIVPMAFLPTLPILVVAGFFLGLSWGPFNPMISTLIQNRVPEDQHGRVFGVQTAAFYAAPPLGMVLTGISVERFGVDSTYLVLAAILVLTALLTIFTKSLRANF